MINLVSNDGNRFDQLLFYIHNLWMGPLQIIITTVVLYFYIGISSLYSRIGNNAWTDRSFANLLFLLYYSSK